jgi:hypothetical protein
MTTETKTLIDFTDILAIQYQCTKCRTTFAVPISMAIDHPMKCFNCREEWYTFPDDNNRAAFNKLTQSIAQSVHALSNLHSSGIKVNVRLEVAVHEKKVA